jgi:hypothetical protein
MATTALGGPPAGTLPVEAVTDDGDQLRVGVWRWPFDPVMTGLRDAVTPSSVARFLGDLAHGSLQLTVLVYRPAQRAVVRAVDERGTVFYVKALVPRATRRLVERHERLAAAGVPVPAIIRRDDERGLIAMPELAGPTVRDRIRQGSRYLPPPDEYETVLRSFAATELPRSRPAMGRVAAGLRHAAMLATVLDADHGLIERVVAHLEPAADRAAARTPVTIHGDLYEAQLITGTGRGRARRITGVLDLDDAGPGDPYDDRATVLGHLLERLADPGPRRTSMVRDYLLSLRREFGRHVDAEELDIVTAGVLVGLATGPFRIQSARWSEAVVRRLALAEHLLHHAGSTDLRVPS